MLNQVKGVLAFVSKVAKSKGPQAVILVGKVRMKLKLSRLWKYFHNNSQTLCEYSNEYSPLMKFLPADTTVWRSSFVLGHHKEINFTGSLCTGESM